MGFNGFPVEGYGTICKISQWSNRKINRTKEEHGSWTYTGMLLRGKTLKSVNGLKIRMVSCFLYVK